MSDAKAEKAMAFDRRCPAMRLWELLDELAQNRSASEVRILFRGKKTAGQWIATGRGMLNREILAIVVSPSVRKPGTVNVVLQPELLSKDPCP